MSDQPDHHWYHELGFTPNTRTLRSFRNAVKIFMLVKPHRQHIVPWDNTVGFDNLVLDFIEQHAENYWGGTRELNADDNTPKYPEDSARIVEGLRNLLANKIREFNKTKGSASYSLTLPYPPRLRPVRRKRRAKRPSCCSRQIERMLADNVDDFEGLALPRPNAEAWCKVKRDEESANVGLKQEGGYEEHEGGGVDTKGEDCSVKELKVGMVKKEEEYSRGNESQDGNRRVEHS